MTVSKPKSVKKKATPVKKKGGKPLREFSKTQFEKLCEIQCTKREICNWYGTTDKTLEDWCKRTYDGQGFSEVFRQKRGTGIVSLRRAQFRMAQKNVTMAIFLGKQFLGQKDAIRQEHTGKDGGPIKSEKPAVDWSKFSVDQLKIIAGMMEQVNPDGSSRSNGGKDPDGPSRAKKSKS